MKIVRCLFVSFRKFGVILTKEGGIFMIKLCDGKKYSTYILELIRNNGITNIDGESFDEKKPDEEAPFSFLMFDYFDALYCKELRGDEKKYLNYLSIENAFEDTIQHSKNYKVSYKTLSLYCKSNNELFESDEEFQNIFSIISTGENLSSIPFLGLIQISLCKDNYIRENMEGIEIDSFLENCENRIIAIVEEQISSNVRMQLFRSSTTGDFCLVLRTDSIEAIYNVAIALNGTQNEPNEMVKMLTFTNVGIECKYLEGIGYATLDKNFVSSHSEIEIALRFSADEALRKTLQGYLKNKGNGKLEMIKGLFGRYEYLLNIGLDEFSDIYPFLCELKLGKRSLKTEKSELENILRKSCVRNINERILVGLEIGISGKNDEFVDIYDIENDSKESDDQEEKKEVFNKNEGLFKRIEKLERMKDIFQEEHFAFQDLIRGMKEIYKAFSSAGMDKESYINWRIFHEDMNILCGCIEQMLEYYGDWEKKENISKLTKKWYRGTVLGDWRKNLQAINRYTTLVQNVNYQTYQAPIYEIQTQIDTEKAMVAYREAMRLYITDGIQKLSDRDDIEMVYPVIYPDLSKDTVEIAAPFKVRRPDGVMRAREIICTVPSFEYFGRLYDLLPWIIHETSHHLKVTERGERNRFVTKYIFSYVFNVIMKEPLFKLSDCDFYECFGIVENYLATSMSEVAQEEMFALKDFKKFNFERLILEIDKWFEGMFPLGVGYNGKVHNSKEEHLKKQMFNFWLDAYRKERILDDSNLDMILRTRDENILGEKEELAELLLDKYYENLCKELKDEKINKDKICVADLYDYECLEAKLADCTEAPVQNKAAVREYCYQVIVLYRIMKINLEGKEKKEDSKRIKVYLKKVFEHYKKNYMEEIKKNNMMTDTVVMHIMRSLGLMNDDFELFQKEMGEIMRNVDNSVIMQHKEIRQKIYLEAYADILMAISLQLSSFGYCRQVLQTVSDAKIMDREYEYEDINYERWRTIAAVLLDKEGAKSLGREENGKIKVYAKTLIDNGKIYCKYTFKCILEKLSKLDEIKENEKTKKLLEEFLWKMYSQIEKYLGRSDLELEKKLLLHILLQGDKEICSEKSKKAWEKYKKVAKFCDGAKYNFWRIDCFCRGIGNIVQDEYITVSKDLFDHMKSICKKADSGSTRGCLWEKDYDFLVEPKRDVGEFYNSPEQVHEKTPDQKLENTIDFIQNYYYFNRFRIMNKSVDSLI